MADFQENITKTFSLPAEVIKQNFILTRHTSVAVQILYVKDFCVMLASVF